MRRVIAFPCAGETLVGTLDEAAGTTGLLIVSGGNEIRSGAHRGMALLAAEVAARGFPVLRYDRRGVGDSTGENGGFLTAGDDLRAAATAFRAAAPHLTRLVGFGNCDAASALALFGREAGIDALLLANPWIVEDADDLPPAAAIRARYARRLADPAAWARLLRGGVDLRKLARGLTKLAARRPAGDLASRVIAAIGDWGDDAHVILAAGDATAIAFRDAARNIPVQTVATDSHSFARSHDRDILTAAVLHGLDAAADACRRSRR